MDDNVHSTGQPIAMGAGKIRMQLFISRVPQSQHRNVALAADTLQPIRHATRAQQRQSPMIGLFPGARPKAPTRLNPKMPHRIEEVRQFRRRAEIGNADLRVALRFRNGRNVVATDVRTLGDRVSSIAELSSVE